jgi:hypothetical protein
MTKTTDGVDERKDKLDLKACCYCSLVGYEHSNRVGILLWMIIIPKPRGRIFSSTRFYGILRDEIRILSYKKSYV